MSFQNQMNQANNPFVNLGNNPEEFINNVNSMADSGNDMVKQGLKSFCQGLKSKGLDNLDGYDKMCNTATSHHMNVVSMVCVLFIVLILTRVMLKNM